MIGVYENAKAHDYYATYFKQMIAQYGGLGAAKCLLAKQEIQEVLMHMTG